MHIVTFICLILFVCVFYVPQLKKLKGFLNSSCFRIRNRLTTNKPPSCMDKKQLDAMPERNREAIKSLEKRELPQYLKTRIEEQKRGQLPWTSTASVNDWALMHQLQLKPLGLVTGCSHYYIGYSIKNHMSNISNNSGTVAKLPWQNQFNNPNSSLGIFSQEIKEYSSAFREACELALQRLQEEAELHGAHAVIDVKLEHKLPSSKSHIVEFNAIGTAVLLTGYKKLGPPLLCTTSMIEFTKLLRAGTLPLGLALGVGVFYASTTRYTQRQQSLLNYKNTEISEFSQDIYRARNIAVRYMLADAAQLGGAGVLGYYTNFSTQEMEKEHGEDDSRTDHILQYLCLGTVIAKHDETELPDIELTLNLTQ